jgi:hypothetical protein
MGVACWMNSDMLRLAAGESTRFLLNHLHGHSQLYLLTASIALFSIYMLAQECIAYRNRLEPEDKYIFEIYNHLLYRFISLFLLLTSLVFFFLSLILYYKNFLLLKNQVNHLVLVFMGIGIGTLIAHYFMKLPKHIHRHTQKNVRDILIDSVSGIISCLFVTFGFIYLFIWNDPVREDLTKPVTGEKGLFREIADITKFLGYVIDIIAIGSGIGVLIYFIPILWSNSSALHMGSQMLSQKSWIFRPPYAIFCEQDKLLFS